MARNIGWTGGKADIGNAAGFEGGGDGAETLNLDTVFEGTNKNQPDRGTKTGPGGTGSTGTASTSR